MAPVASTSFPEFSSGFAERNAKHMNMALDEIKEDITPHNPTISREISPARGVSLPQDAAIPSTSPRASLREWQAKHNIDRDAQIRIAHIAHMRYQHPDLDEITRFLRDFGMSVVGKGERERWFGGYGRDAYVYYAREGEKQFLGGTFEVESWGELEKASKIAGASPITELKDAPGGGHMVTLHDPEGFPINLLYGQTPKHPGPMPTPLTTNYEVEKPRVGAFHRFTPGPAAVHKLGHYGLVVADFAPMLTWYTHTFNFAPTDFLYVDTEDGRKKDVAVFLHIDTGPTPTDHHSFFMSTLPPSPSPTTAHVHHASFEVHDFDAQNLGHAWLARAGYTSVWGVGRHVLGSQVFDYWWDTSGNMVEHYADGDLVGEGTPVAWGAAGSESLAVWGPECPSWFLD